MARIPIRNLDETVVRKLKHRAKRAGRSLEAEARVVLEQAADEPKLDMKAARKLAEEFSSRFKGRKSTDSAELVREDRDRKRFAAEEVVGGTDSGA